MHPNDAVGKIDVINVESDGALVVAPIAARSITISATGTIVADNDTDAPDVAADRIVIRSANGDVGVRSDPLLVDTEDLTASGKNVFVRGIADLGVREVNAEDDAEISAGGNLFGTGGGANVIAKTAALAAGGNIGSHGR